MYILGGLQEKIKVITVSKTLIDIQYANLYDLEDKYENNTLTNEFLILAKQFRRIPFLYESIDLTSHNTILLRNVLYNPTVIPITIYKKDCIETECVYTHTPVVKSVSIKGGLYAVPNETQVYITGLIFDLKHQGELYYNMLNYTIIQRSKFIVPEYPDYIQEQNKKYVINFVDNDINKVILDILNQILYAIYIYEITHNFYITLPFNKRVVNPKNDLEIKSWFTDYEIEVLRYLLQYTTYQWTYNLDPLQTLGSNIDLFLYGINTGTDDKHIKAYFEDRLIQDSRLKMAKITEQEQLEGINKARRYINIINNKLDSTLQQKIIYMLSNDKYLRLAGGSMAVSTMLVNVTNPEVILSFLSNEQQEIVINEYNRQEKFMKAYRTNKCGHLGLLSSIINSKKNKVRINSFIQLKEYMNDEKQVDGFIYCKVCKFHIICQHVYDKWTNEFNDVKESKINDILLEYAIRIKINRLNEYYCKYCGEVLIKDLDLEYHDVKMKYTKQLTENDISIRDYLWSVIMNTLKSYKNELYVNERSFASKLSSALFTLLTKKIINFDDSSKITIVIYVYAYILYIIKVEHISFMNIDINLPTNKIAEQILHNLYKKYNQLIISLTVTTTYIQSEFINAYKEISNKSNHVVLKTDMENNLATFIFTIDPFYNYARTVFKLINKKKSYTINEEFNAIMGRSIKEIIKTAKQNAKNPAYADIINKRFGSVVNVVSIDYFLKQREFNLYSSVITIENADIILNKFILQSDYKLYYFASYIMMYKYTVDIHTEDEYIKYFDVLTQFKQVEKQMLESLFIYYIKPSYNIVYTKNSHIEIPKIDITELYDENGQKHIWNVYYYDGEIGNIYNKKGKLTDVGCSICGITKNTLYKLNVEETWKSVNIITDVSALFTYYKTRCPISDLHNWDNNTCTKCQITTNMIEIIGLNKLNNDIISYYTKFLPKFIQGKRKTLDTLIVNDRVSHMSKRIIDWEFDYSYIVRVAKLANISPNVIEAIGLNEQRKYADIEHGIYLQGKNVEINNVYSAYAELIFLMKLYSEELDKNRSLPPLIDYCITGDALLDSDTDPVKIHNYILQSICEIILQIPDTELAITFLTKIILNQKMFAQPVNFNWKLLQETENDGVYLGDDIGEIGEDMIYENILKSKNSYYNIHNSAYHPVYEDPNVVSDIIGPKEYIYTYDN